MDIILHIPDIGNNVDHLEHGVQQTHNQQTNKL
jgi:hypothetical protein